jgi:hypothetical protein
MMTAGMRSARRRRARRAVASKGAPKRKRRRRKMRRRMRARRRRRIANLGMMSLPASMATRRSAIRLRTNRPRLSRASAARQAASCERTIAGYASVRTRRVAAPP